MLPENTLIVGHNIWVNDYINIIIYKYTMFDLHGSACKKILMSLDHTMAIYQNILESHIFYSCVQGITRPGHSKNIAKCFLANQMMTYAQTW